MGRPSVNAVKYTGCLKNTSFKDDVKFFASILGTLFSLFATHSTIFFHCCHSFVVASDRPLKGRDIPSKGRDGLSKAKSNLQKAGSNL
jgi:hypothetical protein